MRYAATHGRCRLDAAPYANRSDLHEPASFRPATSMLADSIEAPTSPMICPPEAPKHSQHHPDQAEADAAPFCSSSSTAAD